MRAACCLDRDGTGAERAFLGIYRCRFDRFLEFIDLPHEHEDHKSNNDEVDDSIQKGAII